MNNPMMMLMQIMKSGGNPQQLITQLMESNLSNNPMVSNALKMVQNQDSSGLEQLARNISKERGIDVDKIFYELKNNFKQ